MDDSFGFLRDIKRFLKSYGWYEGDEFSNWLKKQLQALTGRPNLRFKDLQSDTKRFKELYVVGTNLSTQMEQLFCAEYTPDMPVWKAVRISMSIPLFFAAVKENSDILVDGGVTWNYPIDLFDDKMYKPAKKAEGKVTYTKYDEDHIYNKETLGFRVDTLDEIQAEKDSWRAPPRKIENIADYAAALLSFMLDMANKAHLHKNDWDRTVFIDALGVSATDFSLSDAQVAALVESGEKRTETYFEWFEDPNSKPAPLNRV